MSVPDLLVPYLQWLAPESDRLLPDGIEDGQEPRLIGVLEHFCETYNEVVKL